MDSLTLRVGRSARAIGHIAHGVGRLVRALGHMADGVGRLAWAAGRFIALLNRFEGRIGRFFRRLAASLAPRTLSSRPMPYTKRDLIERSGLPDRTIRNYIARGLLPRPRGHGLAAEYDEDHMLRAVAIGRMRGEGLPIDAIAEQIAGWSTAKFKRFVAKTEPQTESPPPEAHPVRSQAPDLLSPSPAAVRRIAADGAASRAEALQSEPIAEIELIEAPSWRIYPLITGLGLIVEAEASPVVRRVAAEIVSKYGRGR